MPVFVRRFGLFRQPLAWVVLLAVVALFWVVAHPLAASKRLQPGAEARTTPIKPVPNPPPVAVQDKRPALTVVYLTADGFEPPNLNLHSGENILMIRNNSGQDDLTFQVTKAGQAPGAGDTTKSDPAGFASFKLQLSPGDLTLTQAADPGQPCKITVAP